jgi:hypothetical protein
LKKETLLAPLLLSLIMISTIMLPAAATDYTKIGVRVGDTADYTYSYPLENSTTATGKFSIEILQINGTNVTIEGPNGIITDNLLNGNQILPDGTDQIPPYLVAANLSQGDNIFQHSPYYIWSPIETITMIVAGHNRTVNYVRFEGPILLPCLFPGETWGESYEAYYDKVTGLLVEINDTVWGRISNGTKPSHPIYVYILTLTSTTAFPKQHTCWPWKPTMQPPATKESRKAHAQRRWHPLRIHHQPFRRSS